MHFDPESAADLYAQKDDDELVRIAFLEETYLEEAKELAKNELAQRGFRAIDQRTIERVRGDMEQQRLAKIDAEVQGLESEELIPSWRQAIRLNLAPHRNGLSGLAIALIAALMLNSTFGWSVLGMDSRNSQALAVLIALIWFVFIAPTRAEFKEKFYSKDGRRK